MSSSSEKTKWNAAAYAANSVVQQAWARELIARLDLRGDEWILDVGCGDGKVTAEIARAVPHGVVVGVDASAEMIAFAKTTFPPARNPNLNFYVCDARRIGTGGRGAGCLPVALHHDLQEAPFDVVFSNAALHWVDDHQAVLMGIASVLETGGRLVVSCGGKGNAHDVFLALRPEMRSPRWREYFRQMPTPYFFYSPADYEKWLPKAGFKTQTVKLVPKDAAYEGPDGFATWLRTTWIPYVQRVPEPMREEFIAAVTRRYLAKHPVDADGKVHVKMVRLQIEALKA